MALRSGHGAGRGAPRLEVLPPNELPSASPLVSVRPERDANGRFLPGNRSACDKRQRVGPRGLQGIDKTAPAFRPYAKWGARYAAHRRRELAQAHGGEISSGVGAIVESAALTMAASRYLSAKAAETGDPEMFKQASALASTARQHELAAWELAARESQVRPKTNSIIEQIMAGSGKR